MALKKIGLVTASALCSINLWTGAPLFAVWVGSKVQGNLNNLSMTAVFSVIVVLAAMVFLLASALTWLNAKYDELTGRPAAARHTSPWLRSMRDEREEDVRQQVRDQRGRADRRHLRGGRSARLRALVLLLRRLLAAQSVSVSGYRIEWLRCVSFRLRCATRSTETR